MFLITKSNWGGAQRYVYDLATNLSTDQYDVTVALGGDGTLSKKLTVANIHTVPINQLTNTLSPHALLRIIAEIRSVLKTEQPDILHTNSSIAGFAGVVAGRLVRIQNIVFTAHGWAFNEDRPLWQKIVFKFFHWLTIIFSHQTITVSETLQRQMDWPLTTSKMTTVSLAINPPQYISRSEARTKLAAEYSDATFWCGTIAELHPIKNHRTVIAALPKLVEKYPQLKYVIVGDGECRQVLETQVKQMQLQSHVHFTGHIDNAARYVTAFDVFLLPSLSEAAGYVLHEAGHAGVPIIASRVGGIPELVTDNTVGTLINEPTNPQLWEQAIDTALAQPSTIQAQADNLQKKIRDYALEHMIDATQNVYRHSVK